MRRRAVAQREPLSPTRAAAVASIGAVTALALWFVLYALIFSGLQERHQQHVLYSHLRENLALVTVPIGGQIKPGTPVALFNSTRGGIAGQVAVEGTTSRDLTAGPGHLASTPLPGQPGTSVFFGRSATFGSPFAHITSLRTGDVITVVDGQGTFGYRVDRIRRPGDPLPTVIKPNESRLTLVTSTGSGWRSGWAPSHVVYVDSSLVTGKLQPVPAGRPASVTQNALPLHSDTSGLIRLFLWLQALVLLTAGLVYARLRWAGWGAWLVGVPIALAVLWGTTSSAMLLLPNIA